MKFVTPQDASTLAVDRRCAWTDLAWGVAHDLEQKLGPPSVGDHLPGLGELLGWGILSDDETVTGAIYTGFRPHPTSVMIMLSGRCSGTALSISSLALLLELPSRCFDRLTIRSLVSECPATRIADRGEVVLETRSDRAAQLAERVTNHLVSDAKLEISAVTAQTNLRVFVSTGKECIDRFIPSEETRDGLLALSDWES
jgi:hypothetical protein